MFAPAPVEGKGATLSHSRDCERLRLTFDRAAEIYQRARPDYPVELYEDLLNHSNLVAGDRLLEIGCASGKATLPLARRGFAITCLEPGPHLAAVARRELRDFDVDVIEARFEDWQPQGRFALVFAATSWRWIDSQVRYRKAWDALRPGGHLAFWDAAHVFPRAGDPFFREIQNVYEEVGEGLPPGARWPRPGELDDSRREIAASGLFEVVHVRHFDWERIYDSDGYIALLDTFSSHIAMDDSKRERLYATIRARIAERPDGQVRRHWGAVLHLARRLR